MSDFSKYKALEIARVASNADLTKPATNVTAGAVQVVSQSHQRVMAYGPIANAIAAVAESPIGLADYSGHFAGGNIVVSAAQVANTTDYNVITLSKRTGNAAAVVMATANLSNVTVVAFVEIPFVVANVANATVLQGDVLTLINTKTGNGVANASSLAVQIRLEDDL